MHKFRAMLAIVAMAMALIGIGASEADAANCGGADWHAGYAMTTSSGGGYAANGPWFYSPVNGHYYELIPRSTVESAWGVPYASNIRLQTWMNFPCGGANGNGFDIANIVYPWGNSGGVDYTKYDMALIDWGTSAFPTPPTDLVHNYCHPYPGCEGFLGGTTKTFSQALSQGTAMDNIANVSGGAYNGLPACISAPHGGTSCGTVGSGSFEQYNGYGQWVWSLPLGGCKAGAGQSQGALDSDHGGPVYYSNGNNQVSMSGMITGFSNQATQGSPGNACWAPGDRYGDVTFIPWTSVDAGFPGYSLAPMV